MFFTVATLCVVAAVVAAVYIEPKLVRYGVIAVTVLFFGLTANFFRDPERRTPEGERHIVAPADGKIVVVKQVEEQEYLHGKATQISIFMSPLNVHVNRNPISGSVEHVRYVPGEFFAAFEDKASEKNEQTHVGVRNAFGRVLFKQIAGFIARRIVCSLRVGDSVSAGARFGMIKFGSRVDVLLGPEWVIEVKPGERVKAGSSILARRR